MVPSAPRSWMKRLRRTISCVPSAVVPTNSGTRLRTVSITQAAACSHSSLVSVAHSPVVPMATRPLTPLCTSASVRRASSSRSTVSVASQRSAPGLDGVGVMAYRPLMSFTLSMAWSSCDSRIFQSGIRPEGGPPTGIGLWERRPRRESFSQAFGPGRASHMDWTVGAAPSPRIARPIVGPGHLAVTPPAACRPAARRPISASRRPGAGCRRRSPARARTARTDERCGR